MSDSSVRGIVHLIEPTKSFGQKGFRKRVVVLEQDKGRFTNFIPLEFTNDGCDTVDSLRVGQEVEIAYRLSGRKWQKDSASEVKFFLSAEALSFRVLNGQHNASVDDANARLAEAAHDDEDCPF